MKVGIDEVEGPWYRLTIIEKIFGVRPHKLNKLIKKNPKFIEKSKNPLDLILFLVRPWECPGGTGPALIAYGKCVPSSFRHRWVAEKKKRGENPVMYEAKMLFDYYEINNYTQNKIKMEEDVHG